MQVDDVVGAAFLPTDGQASPPTSPGARQGRAHGRRHDREGVAVTGIEVEDGRVARVVTDQGRDRLREARDLRRAMVARSSAAWPASTFRSSPVQHQYLDHRADRRA